jgi:hypothetical protein
VESSLRGLAALLFASLLEEVENGAVSQLTLNNTGLKNPPIAA